MCYYSWVDRPWLADFILRILFPMKYITRQAISDRAYLDFLRTERCIITGLHSESIDPMHIGTRGRGIKTDDEALPVHHNLHLEAHQHGEMSMLRKHAPDDLLRAAFRALARERYREYLESK